MPWRVGISWTDGRLGSSELVDPTVERGMPTKWWFWDGGACDILALWSAFPAAEFKKNMLACCC